MVKTTGVQAGGGAGAGQSAHRTSDWEFLLTYREKKGKEKREDGTEKKENLKKKG